MSTKVNFVCLLDSVSVRKRSPEYIISSKLPSDRPNNHSRSRELRTFLYDVADL